MCGWKRQQGFECLLISWKISGSVAMALIIHHISYSKVEKRLLEQQRPFSISRL